MRSPTSTTSRRPPIERIDDRTVRVIARLPVEDLAELFEVDLPNEDEVETVGGLLARPWAGYRSPARRRRSQG